MKSLLLVSSLALAGVSFALGVNSSEAEGGQKGLVRVGQEAASPEQQAPSGAVVTTRQSFDREEWEGRLADPDLKSREAALDELIARARTDRATREGLQVWAQEASELAWTIRLGLRLLEAEDPGAARGSGVHPWFPTGSGSLGFGPFRWDPFQGDPFGQDPLEWIENLGSPQGSLQDSILGPLGGSTESVQGESIQMQSGPDGVRIELRTQGPDGEEVQVFEGESLEQLLEAHPELEGKVGTSSGVFGWHNLGQPGLFEAHPFGRRLAPPAAGQPLPSDRRVLGVYLRANLQADGELVVSRVQLGSLADRLGVQEGDVLLNLDGGTLRSRDDIARKLMDRAPGDPVRLSVRRGAETKVLTWDPEAKENAAQPLQRVESEADDSK